MQERNTLVSANCTMSGSAQAMKKRKAPLFCIVFFDPPLTAFPLQALWRKNQQEQIDFLAAARGPDIVAIEQDRATSFILDSAPQPKRSTRLDRPMKSISSLAPHPEAEAAAKIFSAGKKAR